MSMRFARLIAPLTIAALSAPAAAATDPTVAQVERSLAATQSMTASFVQTNGKGQQLGGQLSLKRPGRARFDYGSAANMLMVADGTSLYFLDYAVGQKSRWPIAKSPLGPLLSGNPDLQRIARPMPAQDPRVVLLRVRDARRPEFGTLILAFIKQASAPGGLQLEGWTAIDAQNKKTTVKLDQQRYNVAVPDSAFQFAEPKKRGRA
ncbi:outer membrane lipoprotein carrier protein LolA [Sphingomonas sp.]|uniref:LolA family protein n=1 Tax=Sphingomonas sp. TaxID=28214 RepID=UPI002869FEE2|nr:outer membrane lipoprotein carrier protein LolA [Sphingomonas sp.]